MIKMDVVNSEEQSNINFEKLAKMELDQKIEYLEIYFKDKEISDDYKRLPQELMNTYYEGYLRSVIDLLPKMKNDRSLFFPLTFLLSHYMELWIKTMGLFYAMDFNYDMKGLKITGHNIRKLILDPTQLDELLDREINIKEVKEILKIWEYFEDFTTKRTELSIAMRYPVMPIDNLATINNYQDYENIDVDEYIIKAHKIISKTQEIYIKFMTNNTIESLSIAENLKGLIKK